MQLKIGERPYKCEQCLLNFAEKGNLKRHEAIHSGFKYILALV